MDLHFPATDVGGYRSASQKVRVLSEDWAVRNLYCPECSSDHLRRKPNNQKAVDLDCPNCESQFQLKSGRSIRKSIPGAAFSTMDEAIRNGLHLNLLCLQYGSDGVVLNLILVPWFFFTMDCIERRPPLSCTARRACWVGCNIRLDKIPDEGKIRMVADGMPSSKDEIRSRYDRLASRLVGLRPEQRGWTFDVLGLLRSLGVREFTIEAAYELEEELARMHPANRNVKAKIRQQLQILRDLGILEFVGRGKYRFAESA